MLAIVPLPTSMTPAEGHFTLDSKTAFHASGAATPVARLIAQDLRVPTGLTLRVTANKATKAVTFTIKADKELGDEGYRLRVRPEGVQVTAQTAAGLFYGGQTLRQLLPAEAFGKAKASGVKWQMPSVDIVDVPRFRWRGLMLDVARHFMPKEEIIKFVDLLALHKMNSLHLHLTEDQGWRIEIKRYPKLTEVGAWRKETVIGTNSGKYDGKRHGGFYTQKELKEIVKYAAARYVNIVPEIEMPGHAQAAIAAYPELGNLKERLEVWQMWGVNPNVFNVEEKTVKFLQNVLDEVMQVFPSKFIHVGGDECPKDQWKASPRVQELIKQRGTKDEHGMQSWFIKQMDTYLAGKGRRLLGWDEILEGGLAPGATVMSWRGMEGGITAAKAGHDVVMAPTDTTYFDYYQAKPTEKEPYAIGGYVPLEKVYNFDPVPSTFTAAQAKHVLGTQGQLWSEYIATPEHLEYMAFPRACALAEVAWTPMARKNFNEFSGRLAEHLKRFDQVGVHYRKLN
ncbi:MAG: beta-N-acetylhexosaminidase [Armatimonadetes bacterium]|nr:beta-N-acetylhexosaminidase [Armatimonadota bacterium]